MKQKEPGSNYWHVVTALVLAFAIARPPLAFGADPERSKGISAHMLPKRVADVSGAKWGLVVSYNEYLKPEQSQPVLQSTTAFLAFVRKQNKSVHENGVWIVTTHPDAYSEPEKKLLQDVKTLCRREHIPLFISRGSQLPDRWQRYDK